MSDEISKIVKSWKIHPEVSSEHTSSHMLCSNFKEIVDFNHW